MDKTHVYFIDQKQSGVAKVDFKSYTLQHVPLECEKVFQIAVANQRIYGISEEGCLVVAHKPSDGLLASAMPKIESKTGAKDKKGKGVKEESEDSEEEEEEEKRNEKVEMRVKIVKIHDIETSEEDKAKDLSDAQNQSILMGSEPEDEEEEYQHVSDGKQRAKSALSSMLGDYEKPRKGS